MSEEKRQIDGMYFWKLFPETRKEKQEREQENNGLLAGEMPPQFDVLADRYPNFANDIEVSRESGRTDLEIEQNFVNKELSMRQEGMTQEDCDAFFGRTQNSKRQAVNNAEWLCPKISAHTGLSEEEVTLRLLEAEEKGVDIGLMLNEQYYKSEQNHLSYFKSSEDAALSAYRIQSLANKQAHVVWNMMNSDQADTRLINDCQKQVQALSEQIFEESRKRPRGFQQHVAYHASNLGMQMLQGMAESGDKVWLYGAGALALAAATAPAVPLAAGGIVATVAAAGSAAVSATVADGIATNSFIRETAETYQNLRAKNLDHSSAKLWAIGAGAVKAGIEMNIASRVLKAYGLGNVLTENTKLSLAGLLRSKRSLEAINTFVKEGGVDKLLAQEGFRDFVISRMKEYGVDVAANVAEEVQQEFTDVVTELLAGAIAKDPDLQPKDALERLTQTAKQSSKEFFYGMLPGVILGIGTRIGKLNQVSDTLGIVAENFAADTEKAGNTKTQRDPIGYIKNENGKIKGVYPNTNTPMKIYYLDAKYNEIEDTEPGAAFNTMFKSNKTRLDGVKKGLEDINMLKAAASALYDFACLKTQQERMAASGDDALCQIIKPSGKKYKKGMIIDPEVARSKESDTCWHIRGKFQKNPIRIFAIVQQDQIFVLGWCVEREGPEYTQAKDLACLKAKTLRVQFGKSKAQESNFTIDNALDKEKNTSRTAETRASRKAEKKKSSRREKKHER